MIEFRYTVDLKIFFIEIIEGDLGLASPEIGNEFWRKEVCIWENWKNDGNSRKKKLLNVKPQ